MDVPLVGFDLCLLHFLETLIDVITQLQVDKCVILVLNVAELGSSVYIFAVIQLDWCLVSTQILLMVHLNQSVSHQIWTFFQSLVTVSIRL